MNRRLFLGLIGGSMAAASTPEIFRALVSESRDAGLVQTLVPSLTRYVNDICFWVGETGFYSVERGHDGLTLIGTGLSAGGGYRWAALPGYEIVMLPNAPALAIVGPSVTQWAMVWTEHQPDGRHRYMADSKGHDRVSMTVGDTPEDVHDWLTARDHTFDDDWPFASEDYDEAGD